MIHWIKRGWGGDVMCLAKEDGDRVLTMELSKTSGNVIFGEGCDNWFGVAYTPDEAVEMLNEAIEWIRAESGEAK